MIFTVLDFETKDPYIGLDLGAGWPFAVNYPYASLFYPIGWSSCYVNTEDSTISQSLYMPLGTKSLQQSLKHTNLSILKEQISKTKNIICHNAQYDLGCLLALGIDISHLRVYDTKVMAKLYDSTLWSYSLSFLLKKYGLGEKMSGSLSDTVRRFDLLKSPSGKSINQETKTYTERANKFAYANMDLLQELDFDTMAFYANHDTIGTAKLFKFLYPKVGDKLSHFYSNIQKICGKIRAPGIVVDMANVNKAIEILTPAVSAVEQSLFKRFGKELNLHSTKELPQAMLELGYDLPETDAGNASVNKEFLEEHPVDPLCQEISEYRTLYMLLNTFSIKIRDMQKYSCPDLQAGGRYGRVFPELNLLEARTGRFSSSNPSIQQIPKRNKEYAKLCRSMFTTHDRDKKWFSLDWSNQEGRLQLHYALLNDFTKAQWWLDKFKENPKLDTHSLVKDMMGQKLLEVAKRIQKEPRDLAKTIYLGKSFCMGKAKTAKRLGLPTEFKDFGRGVMETSGPEASILIEKYDKAFPFLSELQKDCLKVIVERGYIVTLGGRQCKRPPKIKGRDYDYKAISLLIQGSAADQMYHALTQADEAGLTIRCIVHDEFNIEGTKEDAEKMKKIMETCVDIKVPSIAEIKEGTNWGDIK